MFNLSTQEYLHYKLEKDCANGNIDEIKDKFDTLLIELSDLKEEIRKYSKREEILEEQIYFRNEFIENILQAITECTTKKELAKYINTTLENSYIEL